MYFSKMINRRTFSKQSLYCLKTNRKHLDMTFWYNFQILISMYDLNDIDKLKVDKAGVFFMSGF